MSFAQNFRYVLVKPLALVSQVNKHFSDVQFLLEMHLSWSDIFVAVYKTKDFLGPWYPCAPTEDDKARVSCTSNSHFTCHFQNHRTNGSDSIMDWIHMHEEHDVFNLLNI